MIFFKTKKTVAELRKTLRTGNIKQWWLDSRDAYSKLSGLASYQTHLLDKTIAALDEQVENGIYAYRLDQLKALHTQLSNWEAIHAIHSKTSSRSIQVEILKSWLNEQLYFSIHTHITLPIKYEETVSTALKKLNLNIPSNSQPLHKQSLYYWWKDKSDLGFFSWRTKATKELDELIYWYSTSIIIDNLDALQKIMDGIEVWLSERKNISHPSRVAAVINLQKILTLEMARELQVRKQDNLNSTLVNSFN
ncbi:Uncharacterised protein [Legionella busanensis]|uniref:Uncharacterized protein n=1 Tax=Legionella busanensis TaxID=190655 RepID=A0A378JGR4_9GAMM|nr:hypothetical protein [Legionella busanensis]STX50011.1 Uncharacterised protein [Legionella busanensis]